VNYAEIKINVSQPVSFVPEQFSPVRELHKRSSESVSSQRRKIWTLSSWYDSHISTKNRFFW